jgi:hypothetical protein
LIAQLIRKYLYSPDRLGDAAVLVIAAIVAVVVIAWLL